MSWCDIHLGNKLVKIKKTTLFLFKQHISCCYVYFVGHGRAVVRRRGDGLCFLAVLHLQNVRLLSSSAVDQRREGKSQELFMSPYSDSVYLWDSK